MDDATAAGVKAAQREADARDKAAQRATAASQKAAAVTKAFNDASNAQMKADAKALDAAARASAQKAAASSKAANAAIAAAQKQVDAATRASRKILDTEIARVSKLDQIGRQQLSREEVRLRARARANQKLQRQRVDASARAMAGEKAADSTVDKAIAGVGSLVAAYAGFAAVEGVSRGIAGAISESRDKSIEFVTSLLSTKDQLAEIATLRGLAFADDDSVKKMAGFSQATGLTIGQSDQFQRQLFGSAAGALQKGNVDEGTLNKAAVLTGQTATRQTKDFGTRGDLVGMLGQFRKYDAGDAGPSRSPRTRRPSAWP